MKTCLKALKMLVFVALLTACAPAATPPSTVAQALTVVPATAEPTGTPTLVPPTATATPSPTPKQGPSDVVGQFVYANWEKIQKRRVDRATKDPAYAKRIDAELNRNRVNFLIYYRGVTHEPPVTEKAVIGSGTIVSYDRLAEHIDVFSMTHDIRAPAVEEYWLAHNRGKAGFKRQAMRLDSAYPVGGMALTRQVWEEAAGLSVDFFIYFKDDLIAEGIDDVFGKIEVDVPTNFTAQPYYALGTKYPVREFTKGPVKLSGSEVLGYVKSVPFPVPGTTEYDKILEHNLRLQRDIVPALQKAYETHDSKKLWTGVLSFIAKRGLSAINTFIGGETEFEFDPDALLMVIPFAEKMKSGGGYLKMPKIDTGVYVVDPAHGDGGVQWVNANAAVNTITKRDVDGGIYPGLDMEVPAGGEFMANPYGDQVTEYWVSVRELVKRKFEIGSIK